ncbi:MAG TPA: hypothetical protein VE076_07275 [Nitrososphaeraceae archaeon]|nr:hypothetical protein [Nitrososphaeraceae archaeon]
MKPYKPILFRALNWSSPQQFFSTHINADIVGKKNVGPDNIDRGLVYQE